MKSGKQVQCVSILLLFLSCICFLAACGTEETGIPPAIDMEKLKESMLQADTTLPEMVSVDSTEELAEQNFTGLSDMDYGCVDSYFYAFAKEGTAEEIAVVRLKDKGDAANLMDSLKKHIENRKGTFRQYAPEQLELLEHALLLRNGEYAALIICGRNGLVQEVFKNGF